MARIGVFTSDFKFYRDVIQLLREWNLPFLSMESTDSVPDDVSVVLSSSRDDFTIANQVKSEKPLHGLRASLAKLLMREKFNNVIIGIDPGPYPGIAVFGDNVLMEAFECPSLQQIGGEVGAIVDSYMYADLEVKVGNGDAPNRDYILSALRAMELRIRVVDEQNTSFPHKIHDNALSAARIAQVEDRYTIAPELQSQNMKRKEAYEKEFVTLKSVIG